MTENTITQADREAASAILAVAGRRRAYEAAEIDLAYKVAARHRITHQRPAIGVSEALAQIGHIYGTVTLDAKTQAVLETLAKSVERATIEKVVGWQPIETAPRDGTPIIGGFFNQPWAEGHREGRIVQCWFQPEFDAFISSCRQMTMAPGYTIDGAASKLHSPDIQDVSHWMPLPTPPETGQ